MFALMDIDESLLLIYMGIIPEIWTVCRVWKFYSGSSVSWRLSFASHTEDEIVPVAVPVEAYSSLFFHIYI